MNNIAKTKKGGKTRYELLCAKAKDKKFLTYHLHFWNKKRAFHVC